MIDYKYAIYSNSTDADADTNAYYGPIDNIPYDPFSIAGVGVYSTMFNGDFILDTGGTRTLTATDFTRKNEFTHASSITLTIPPDIITSAYQFAPILYPTGQTSGNTLTIAAGAGVTVEAESAYAQGALICIYRRRDNVFKVGGF